MIDEKKMSKQLVPMVDGRSIRDKIFVVTIVFMAVFAFIFCDKVFAAGNPYPMHYTYTDENGVSEEIANCTYVVWQQTYDRLGIVLSTSSWGNATYWYSKAEGVYSRGSEPRVNSIVCYSGNPGHVAYVTGVNGNNITVVENGHWNGTYESSLATRTRSGAVGAKYGANTLIGYIYLETEPTGEYMETGRERLLPDGDYQIVSSLNPAFDLDIPGDAAAENGAFVQLWDVGPREYDIFTITYHDSGAQKGFYTITQKGTNKALTIDGTEEQSRMNGMRIDMWESYDSPKQQWSSCRSYTGNGYALQVRCSGFWMSTENMNPTRETRIVQKEGDGSNAQSWSFIPYKPTQTLSAGRYILLADADTSYELDVSGDTGNVENGVNVQLWSDIADSRYNSFDVKPLDNGYYELIHAASGKALDVAGTKTENASNIQLWDYNGGKAQQWAITPQRDGFMLRARCSYMRWILKTVNCKTGRTSDSYSIVTPMLRRGNL